MGGNVLDNVLARVATVVVGRARKLVLHHAVEQYQTIAVGLEGEVFKLAGTAVEAHQTTCLAEDAGKLIHDTAVDAAVVVLRGLTCQHHVPHADFVVAEKVVETTGETTLHSGTGRHTGTQGNVTSKGYIKTFHGNAQFSEFQRNTINIASP